MGSIMMNELRKELTDEELAEIKAAEKMAPVYDDDCPAMTDEMLKQFKPFNSVLINLSPSDAKKVKSWGPNYRKILDKLVSLAIGDYELIKRIQT
jgi:hypothetical protein